MTYEEFQTGLKETPDLINEIFDKHEGDFTKHLTDTKGKLVTTTEEQTKGYAIEAKKAIDLAVKQNHENYRQIFESTGVKKNDGESDSDYAKRVLASFNGNTESALYKAVKQELKELKDERETEKKALTQAKIDGKIEAGIGKLKFAVPSHLKKDDEKTAYQKQLADDSTDIFNARYTGTFEDGKLIFTNKKGEAQTENGEPMSADAIMARDFAAKLEPVKRSQGGAGSGNDDVPNPSGNADFLGNTTEEIRKKLSEMGKAVGTDEWAELNKKAHLAAGYTWSGSAFVK